jgi:alanyl-tRNA synthetase
MQAILNEAKKLDKSAYLFSVEKGSGKIAHANVFVPSSGPKELDAKTWATSVAAVIGGKVGFLLSLQGRADTGN